MTILFCVTLDLSDNLTEMRIVEKLDCQFWIMGKIESLFLNRF